MACKLQIRTLKTHPNKFFIDLLTTLGESRMTKTILALAAITLAVCNTNVNASIIYQTETAQNTTGLSTFTTYDENMTGMTVRVTYDSHMTYDYEGTWSTFTDGSSGVDFGTGILSLDGSTWSSNWVLDLTADANITSIFIDAGTGNTVFDVINGVVGSANSSDGKVFNSVFNGVTDSDYITATYSGAVGINGDSPVGDLFRYLTIDFTNGFTNTDTFTFNTDTDNLLIPGDINPVPEPSTILLFGIGITGLVGYNRKRSSSKSNDIN